MLFSSLTFLLYFLPGVVILHRLLPGGWQNLFLLVASLVFYAWGEAKYLPLIAALLLLNWALGLWLGLGRGRRLAMGLGIALNIGVLGFYKYAGFFCRTVGLARLAPQTTLPLGISFFTFQTLAYLIDVYRKEIAPEKNPVDFSAFILLFPQLIAGPIIRYSDLKNELHSRRRPAAPALERGMALFIGGLSLKVLLANPLGELWAAFGGGQGEGVCSLLALAGYGLQIYYDFFGYSLMAMGVGAMLGFTIPRNFNHPYAAASITDFWRRWHITLSGWFRDYVYIPLGAHGAEPADRVGADGAVARGQLEFRGLGLLLFLAADGGKILPGRLSEKAPGAFPRLRPGGGFPGLGPFRPGGFIPPAGLSGGAVPLFGRGGGAVLAAAIRRGAAGGLPGAGSPADGLGRGVLRPAARAADGGDAAAVGAVPGRADEFLL